MIFFFYGLLFTEVSEIVEDLVQLFVYDFLLFFFGKLFKVDHPSKDGRRVKVSADGTNFFCKLKIIKK